MSAPIPMILTCPSCCGRHIDEGEFATKPHHTHACQKCGMVWRPAIVETVGVQFLPGFKNDEEREYRVEIPQRKSRTQSGSIPPSGHTVPITPVHGPHEEEWDRHHSQGVRVAEILAGTPLSIPCPTCMVPAGTGCLGPPRFPKTTMGDYGPDFHEARRLPECGMTFMEGGVEKACQLAAGHETSRHGVRR